MVSSNNTSLVLFKHSKNNVPLSFSAWVRCEQPASSMILLNVAPTPVLTCEGAKRAEGTCESRIFASLWGSCCHLCLHRVYCFLHCIIVYFHAFGAAWNLSGLNVSCGNEIISQVADPRESCNDGWENIWKVCWLVLLSLTCPCLRPAGLKAKHVGALAGRPIVGLRWQIQRQLSWARLLLLIHLNPCTSWRGDASHVCAACKVGGMGSRCQSPWPASPSCLQQQCLGQIPRCPPVRKLVGPLCSRMQGTCSRRSVCPVVVLPRASCDLPEETIRRALRNRRESKVLQVYTWTSCTVWLPDDVQCTLLTEWNFKEQCVPGGGGRDDLAQHRAASRSQEMLQPGQVLHPNLHRHISVSFPNRASRSLAKTEPHCRMFQAHGLQTLTCGWKSKQDSTNTRLGSA